MSRQGRNATAPPPPICHGRARPTVVRLGSRAIGGVPRHGRPCGGRPPPSLGGVKNVWRPGSRRDGGRPRSWPPLWRPSTSLVWQVKTWMAGTSLDEPGHDDEKDPAPLTNLNRTIAGQARPRGRCSTGHGVAVTEAHDRVACVTAGEKFDAGRRQVSVLQEAVARLAWHCIRV